MNNKIKRCLEIMKENNLDEMIVSDFYNLKYLLNISIETGERMIALVLSLNKKPQLFLNDLFSVEKNEDFEIVSFKDSDNYLKLLADSLKGKRIAIDHNFKSGFLLSLMNYHQAEYISALEILASLRSIKDEYEQECLIKASLDNDLVMSKIFKELKIGISEKEIADKLYQLFAEITGNPVSFEPIVSFGKNGADPHHMPDNTLLKEGDSVIIDIGSHYEGYCSDMTRTFLSKNKEIEKIYDIVLKANLAAEEMIKPNVKFKDIDKAARDVIEKAGYGPYFTHRLGHGIGLEDHEPYDVSSSNEKLVEVGMCFSIEPGIYLKDIGGVRIEDLVLVTNKGIVILNKFPKDKIYYQK